MLPLLFLFVAPSLVQSAKVTKLSYPIVHTNQSVCYNSTGMEISCPTDRSQPFFGQDANYMNKTPSYTYRNNGDGTVSDLVTGLMWAQDPLSEQMTATEAVGKTWVMHGQNDWRLPNIKELYSLVEYSGTIDYVGGPEASKPFIDDSVFLFSYQPGERWFDVPYLSNTVYPSTIMNDQPCMFGVNFADGRVKCYATALTTFYIRLVRGKTYGRNELVDNGDRTITDRATGLMWMQEDSGFLGAGRNKDGQLNWAQALHWANTLTYAGHNDWRLPNAKELQSIVDYGLSPQSSASPAIHPFFECTTIEDEAGSLNWGWYWSSTTHVEGGKGGEAVYICFGDALGWLGLDVVDLHGAGAVRSVPKDGDLNRFAEGQGAQNDCVRIYNFVRLVRDA